MKEVVVKAHPTLQKIVLYALLVAICSVPLFIDLGKSSIRLWDESINATSAFEMTQNKNIFVRYFDGEPEMWSIKPPLTIWAQAVSMKIFGYNEWAVRIPSALCALATVLLIFHFFHAELNMPIAGLLSSFVLISSRGYVGHHVSRTGDHDVYLILFLVASVFFFYKYLEHRQKKNVHLTLFVLSCIAAALTKGIVCFAFLPGILVYIIYRRKIRDILKAPSTFISIAVFLVVVVGYYIVRDYYNPGYLKTVWHVEIKNLHLSTMVGETQSGGFFFFLKSLMIGQFSPWMFFLPLCYLLVWFKHSGELNRVSILFTSCIVMCYPVISIAKVKNSWYAAPLLPLLAILVGIGLYLLYCSIVNTLDSKRRHARYLLLSSFTMAVFALPYAKTIRVVTTARDSNMELYGYFMKELKELHPDQIKYSIMHQGWNSHIHFYLEVFNVSDGYEIERKYSPIELRIGERVLTCQESTLEWIGEHFDYEVLDTSGECKYIELNGRTKYMEEELIIAAPDRDFKRISVGDSHCITNVIRADRRYLIFYSELRATDLEKLLRRDGPFTVFMPTNEAFRKLPPEIAAKMYRDMPAITKILLYHIVPGALTAQDIRQRNEIDTMLGEKLSVSTSGNDIMINGARLLRSDIMGSNGIIHIIDKVNRPR